MIALVVTGTLLLPVIVSGFADPRIPNPPDPPTQTYICERCKGEVFFYDPPIPIEGNNNVFYWQCFQCFKLYNGYDVPWYYNPSGGVVYLTPMEP